MRRPSCGPLFSGRSFLLRPLPLQGANRVEIHSDFKEADAPPVILAKRDARQLVGDADCGALFGSEGYERLKKREAAVHRDFSDDDFKRFILSEELRKERSAVARTVRDSVAS